MLNSARWTSRSAAARAFSLTELIVASAITAILLASITSVITLSTRVLPRDDQSADPILVANIGLQRLTEDLRQATRITGITATSVTFKVADRNSDGAEEVIAYSWSGTAGAPLLRAYNAADPETVIASVGSLAFTADTFSASRTIAAGNVEAAEQLLDEYNPSSTGSGGGTDITSLSQAGLAVRPVLPSDTISWRPTRLQYKSDAESSGRTTTMTVRKADENRRPQSGVLQSTNVTNTWADKDIWRTVTLSSSAQLAPTETLCFTLSGSSLLSRSTRVYPDSSVLNPYTGYLSNSTGLSWNYTKNSAFPYRLYGCVTRPSTTTVPYTRCDQLKIRLRATSTAATEVHTTISIPARPEVG